MNKQDERIYRRRKSLLTLVAVAAIATAGAAPAGAQSTVAFNNDPVRIVHYSVGATSVPVSSWGGNLGFSTSGNVSISFVNARGVTATEVEFALRAGKSSEILVDKGTFSPGTSITHDFSVGSQFSDAAALEVVGVTFADGTSWQRHDNR